MRGSHLKEDGLISDCKREVGSLAKPTVMGSGMGGRAAGGSCSTEVSHFHGVAAARRVIKAHSFHLHRRNLKYRQGGDTFK